MVLARLLATAACALSFGFAVVARADASDVATRAHEAYDRGTAAYARGDFASAAREYGAADALVPNPTALQAALDAALRADDPVIGTQLLDRAARMQVGGELAELVKSARVRFAGRTGRVRLACGGSTCLGAIDGVAIDAGATVVVRVGPHTVIVQMDGKSEQRVVDVRADEVVDVAPSTAAGAAHDDARPSSPGPAPPPPGGIAPAWFFTGVGVTVVVAGAAIASAADTSSRHASFVRDGCDRTPSPSCDRASSDGASAQTRTNVLLGVAAGAGVVSAALGLFFVRWSDGASVAVGAMNGAPTVAVRGAW